MTDNSNRTYTLDPERLRGAIEVLKRAAESFDLSQRERIGYRALIISGDVGIIGLVWLYASIALQSVLPSYDSHTTPRWLEVNLILASLMLIGSAVGGTVSLLLNISLIRKAWRERAALKKLGLTNLSKSLWKAGRKHRWLQRLRGAILLIGGAVLLLSAVLSPFILLFNDQILGAITRDWRVLAAVAALVLFYALFGLIMLAARYLRIRREQIELVSNAEKLQEALRELQKRAGDGAAVLIPADILEQVARIESSQIAQERKTAILESAGSVQSGYAVGFAPNAAEQKSALDMAQRIKLEDLVEQLSTGLLRGKADVRGAGEINLHRITSDPVEVEYATDEPGRKIRIVAVRQIGDEAYRTPGPEEQRHA